MIISRLLSPTKQSHQLPLQEIKKSPVLSRLFHSLAEGKKVGKKVIKTSKISFLVRGEDGEGDKFLKQTILGQAG